MGCIVHGVAKSQTTERLSRSLVVRLVTAADGTNTLASLQPLGRDSKGNTSSPGVWRPEFQAPPCGHSSAGPPCAQRPRL